jgi:hypothetical protein
MVVKLSTDDVFCPAGSYGTKAFQSGVQVAQRGTPGCNCLLKRYQRYRKGLTCDMESLKISSGWLGKMFEHVGEYEDH